MLAAGLLTICKINHGSKSSFAYILMAFTIGNGLTNVGFYLTDAIRKPAILDGYTVHFSNFNAVTLVGYTFYLMSL
jgi:hypothetical protein